MTRPGFYGVAMIAREPDMAASQVATAAAESSDSFACTRPGFYGVSLISRVVPADGMSSSLAGSQVYSAIDRPAPGTEADSAFAYTRPGFYGVSMIVRDPPFSATARGMHTQTAARAPARAPLTESVTIAEKMGAIPSGPAVQPSTDTASYSAVPPGYTPRGGRDAPYHPPMSTAAELPEGLGPMSAAMPKQPDVPSPGTPSRQPQREREDRRRDDIPSTPDRKDQAPAGRSEGGAAGWPRGQSSRTEIRMTTVAVEQTFVQLDEAAKDRILARIGLQDFVDAPAWRPAEGSPSMFV